MAYKVYGTEAIAKALSQWKVVARETRGSGSGPMLDEDPVIVAQHTTTLACALVFSGANNLANQLASSASGYSTGYCGFDGIHDGYRNELRHITKAVWPVIAPKLSKCKMVSCVGHNAGGPLCDIFAACANSGRTEDADYVQQSWVVSMPEALEDIARAGTSQVQ